MDSSAGKSRWTAEEKEKVLLYALNTMQFNSESAKQLSEVMGRPASQIMGNWRMTLKPDLYCKLGLEMPSTPVKAGKVRKGGQDKDNKGGNSPSKRLKKVAQNDL